MNRLVASPVPVIWLVLFAFCATFFLFLGALVTHHTSTAAASLVALLSAVVAAAMWATR